MERPTAYQAWRLRGWQRAIGPVLVAVLVLSGIGPLASPQSVAAPEASPETVSLRSIPAWLEPAECQEWLSNGDFERGTLPPWVSSGASGLGDGRESVHGAWLGGADSAVGELLHPVTIPAEISQATLTFWWLADAALEQPADVLNVLVQHQEVVTPLLSLSATAPLGTWQLGTADLTPFAGKTIAVTFLANTDAETPTTFRVDDVALSVCGVPPSDLVVAEVAWDEGHICYDVRNVGEGMAPGGHQAALFIDSSYASMSWVDVELDHEQGHWGCFEVDWICTPPADEVAVQVDYQQWVAEAVETNNERTESWWCDSVPPQILSGPDVSNVTGASADISWDTDEASDSIVWYGQTARVLPLQASDLAPVTAHSVTLAGLQPSTTYQFQVQSTDASSNTVQSEVFTFQTLPPPDTQDPTVSIRDPGVCRETVTIIADASDNQRVDRVEFFVDGEQEFIDYVPAFEFDLLTTELTNGFHIITVTAYDPSGRSSIAQRTIDVANVDDQTAPYAIIGSPAADATVSGWVIVSVSMGDDVGVCNACFYVDGKQRECASFPVCPASPYYEFGWDTTSETNGQHSIAVEATDKDNKKGYDLIKVQVNNAAPPAAQPNLSVEKLEVFQHVHQFVIEMTVKNSGPGWASNIKIVNSMRGFQPRYDANPIPSHASNSTHYNPTTRVAQCQTSDSTVGIAPNSTELYICDAVPVLHYPNPPAPMIGSPIQLSYEGPDGKKYTKTVNMSVLKTTQTAGSKPSYPLATAHADAVGESDYLIVTNPVRLNTAVSGSAANLEIVLEAMAELASRKWGVLGYLGTNSNTDLRKLIAPKGTWAAMFKHGFYPSGSATGGYLLIVGETEVVPAWTVTSLGTTIRDSDHSYADTYSGYHPDLIVGRAIGNNGAALANVLWNASVGSGFNRTNALVVSGTGTGQDAFVNNVNEVETILKSQGFSVDKIHWKDYSGFLQRLQQFLNLADDQDVIYFRDHGTSDAWDNTVSSTSLPSNFGNTQPFAFGCACSSGNYETGDDYNLAEAFLDSDASLYIGSTELSAHSLNNEGCKLFFSYWTGARTVAEAFTLVERQAASSGESKWQRWVAMYNIYGDPKLGKPVAPPAAAHPQASAALASSLPVVVPDYQVTTVSGRDHVEIPGGQMWLVEDQPQIPFYAVTVDYPPGTRIQGVTLAERSGLVTDTGLNLPVASMEPDAGAAAQRDVEQTGGVWLPEEEYRWEVVDHPDNSVTLVLSVYPFYYNPLSTDVRFYKDYLFEIDDTASSVSISSLSTDETAYPVGQMVKAGLSLANAGAPQDVVVEAVVRRYLGDEVVAGLLLRTLQGLTGPASFATEWDSAGAEPGYYSLEAVLRDEVGNELDREIVMFQLGISSGEITAFTATPRWFQVGDPIDITLQFSNTGTLPIDGRAVIQIRNSAGTIVQEFIHEVALAPSADADLNDIWDTQGHAEEAYHLVAYVAYDSQAAEPWTAEVDPWPRTYLPLALRRNP